MAVDDSYTKALLHMDGSDASTTFTDESGKTWTRSGNAQILTEQYKFGGASGYFDGVGDYIDTPDHDDFTVGSFFTVDFWAKRNGGTGDEFIFGQAASDANAGSRAYYMDLSTNYPRAIVYSSTTAYVATSSITITDSNWNHYAMVRDSATMYLFINGIERGKNENLSGVTINNSPNRMAIGRLGEYDGSYFKAYIDEFRFSNGIARWTNNFTPPTAPYYGIGHQIIWSS
jgi:hypothetical protein